MPKDGTGAAGVAGSATAFALGSNPVGWAILGATALWKIGTGIFNFAKGRKMEKQAKEDRQRYINTMGSWVEWGQQQQQKVAGAGLDFSRQMRQEAQGYSQQGRAMEQDYMSRYFDTLGQTTGRISEKDLMKQKFGLGG